MQNVQALAEALEVNYFAFPQKAQGVNYGRVVREHHQVFICCSCLLLCCCIKKATFFAAVLKAPVYFHRDLPAAGIAPSDVYVLYQCFCGSIVQSVEQDRDIFICR